MLGKVMKHEMRISGRTLLPFFGLAVVLSALLRLLQFLSGLIWQPVGLLLAGLVSSLGVLLLMAVVVGAVVMLIVRFYQSMMGREAYLTFSLPVKTASHLWARLLVALVYSLLACVVAVLCGLILIPGFAGIITGNFTIPLNLGPGLTVELAPAQLSAGTLWSAAGLVLFFVVLAILSNLTRFYASFAIGTRLGPNRIVGSLFGYLILNGAMTVLLLPFMAVPLVMVATRNSTFIQALTGVEARMNEIAGNPALYAGYVVELLWVVALILGGLMLLFSAIELFLCWYFYGKRLNLE